MDKLERLQLELRWVIVNLEHWEYLEDKARNEARLLRIRRNELTRKIEQVQKEKSNER